MVESVSDYRHSKRSRRCEPLPQNQNGKPTTYGRISASDEPLHWGETRELNALETTRKAMRFGSSFRRVAADPHAVGSPLLRNRSLSWRFMTLDVAFADLRAAAKAGDASLNDAFLAALLGAFRGPGERTRPASADARHPRHGAEDARRARP